MNRFLYQPNLQHYLFYNDYSVKNYWGEEHDLIMVVALISTTALAVSNEQTCDDSMSTASLSSGTNLKVNGVTYFIPGGATSTIG